MKRKIELHDLSFEVMIPSTQIEDAVKRVAKQIDNDYASSEAPLLIGVLNGSFMFMSDLSKNLNINCELSFVKLSSYCGTESSGQVKELIGLNNSIEGRSIIIVEDIVDTGCSISQMVNMLKDKGAGEIKVCTLFFKPNSYSKEIKIDYKAFDIGNEFIVGYGLDYNELGRTLKDIYVVADE